MKKISVKENKTLREDKMADVKDVKVAEPKQKIKVDTSTAESK